ncbi:MAG TPA: aminopeptidase [Acidobacteriaceae bacterium]|jgi:aminopeptidase|nr:aminopeptidase [Acidobacteriaceae bacterium]
MTYQKNQNGSQSAVATANLSFEEKLDRLAEVAVRVGLGLGSPGAPTQELVMSASTEALPLVRRITEHAYKAGAELVTTLLSDEESTLLRYRNAPDTSFDRVATWLQDGIATAYRSGAARLAIAGGNPALLSKEDPARVGRANVAMSKATKPAMELITRHEINWTIIACATPTWARAVFPNEPEEVAIARLWDAIFAASRADVEDPIAAWKAHGEYLKERVDFMNARRFSALHFRGPGTDLRVGLADDHLWAGGGTRAGNGVYCQPNIPTEEVFTTPHKDRVDGTVRSSKPLSYQGTLIEEIAVRFEGGRVVEANAKTGREVLERMIGTDEGARKLGEVALVPHSSPIAHSGVLFWNTLFDENAASHIALGQAYSTCLIGGEKMDEATLASKGANASLIHVDWMIGSGEMNVDGITASGSAEPLMRKGEWV